jgi:hypothetical protein
VTCRNLLKVRRSQLIMVLEAYKSIWEKQM